MPSDMRPSRLAKRPFSRRSTSLRGCGISQNGFCPGLGSGLGEPWKNAARTPDSARPSIPPSVCAGVGLLWHQSTSVVVPLLIWLSAPTSVEMRMSSGRNMVARPACMLRKYSRMVQLPATPRRLVCHVCMCALIRPGMTILPVPSTTSASAVAIDGATAAMRSPSIRMSPFGRSPSLESIVTMDAPLISVFFTLLLLQH